MQANPSQLSHACAPPWPACRIHGSQDAQQATLGSLFAPSSARPCRYNATLEIVRDAAPHHWKPDHACLVMSPSGTELAEQIYDHRLAREVSYLGLNSQLVDSFMSTQPDRPQIQGHCGDPGAGPTLPFEHFGFDTIVDHVCAISPVRTLMPHLL